MPAKRSKERTIRLTLPLPDSRLSQNSRVHWATRARLSRWARGAAKLSAQVACADNKTIPWRKARIRAIWYFRDRRYCSDSDNLIARMKSTRDGLADAGIVSDDQAFVVTDPEQQIDPMHPRLALVIERIK